MSQRRASGSRRCTICRINAHYCVCDHIKPLELKTKVSLIVHVRELKLTSNTAQFVKLLAPNQAEIFIRGRMNEVFEPTPILERTGTPLFLYPHEDSEELNADFMAKNPGPYHLIVPDGNWSQARKVRAREEKLSNIKAVKLPPGIVAEYQLRKAPQPNWVSTYEAVAHTLAVLEGESVCEHMMLFFRHWVKTTLKSRFIPNLPVT